MREFAFFVLAIAATIAVLATIDPHASSPRPEPPPAHGPVSAQPIEVTLP